MKQEPHKIRLWNGAAYKRGAGERQAHGRTLPEPSARSAARSGRRDSLRPTRDTLQDRLRRLDRTRPGATECAKSEDTRRSFPCTRMLRLDGLAHGCLTGERCLPRGAISVRLWAAPGAILLPIPTIAPHQRRHSLNCASPLNEPNRRLPMFRPGSRPDPAEHQGASASPAPEHGIASGMTIG